MKIIQRTQMHQSIQMEMNERTKKNQRTMINQGTKINQSEQIRQCRSRFALWLSAILNFQFPLKDHRGRSYVSQPLLQLLFFVLCCLGLPTFPNPLLELTWRQLGARRSSKSEPARAGVRCAGALSAAGFFLRAFLSTSWWHLVTVLRTCQSQLAVWSLSLGLPHGIGKLR